MTFKLGDRILETTATTGAGGISLAGAVAGFRTFSAELSDGDTTSYALMDANGTEWETGTGTYVASGNKLQRTTITRSSNSNNAITLSAGTHSVECTINQSTPLGGVSGANKQIQFNDVGSGGGAATLTWDKSTSTLALNGIANFGDGGVTNYISISATGALTLHGSASLPVSVPAGLTVIMATTFGAL